MRILFDQQNLGARKLAVIVLLSTSWPRIQRAITEVTRAVDASSPGSYKEIEIP